MMVVHRIQPRMKLLPRHPAILSLLALAGLAVGCSSGGGGDSDIRALDAERAARLNAGRSAFSSPTPPPIRPQTYLAAGQLAESRGDLEGAAAHYRSVLERGPDDPEALFRLGVVMSRQQSEAAPAVWRRYLAVTGQPAVAYANLGFCYELLGQPDAAESAYRSGILADSTDETCRINFGLFLARAGRMDAAADQLELVLAPAQVWYNIASAQESVGRHAEARASFARAAELDPELTTAEERRTALSMGDRE